MHVGKSDFALLFRRDMNMRIWIGSDAFQWDKNYSSSVDKYSRSHQQLTISVLREARGRNWNACSLKFNPMHATITFQKKSYSPTTLALLGSLYLFSQLSSKVNDVLYSPGCRPLTRLGGTLTSFTGLPGNEVEESVSLWPAGRHSPLVSQTKFNRQSQDMKGDCCSQTDVTNAGGQANNRTCLWKYQNITCHGVFWLLSKRGTCIVFCSQPFFFLHPFTFFLSFPWYPWAKQAIHITFIWYNVHNTQTDAC